MKLRDLKKEVFKIITDNESENENQYSKEEIQSFYNKIISITYKNLKVFNFNKKGKVNLYRLQNNEIYQLLNFQKSNYGATLTINISLRPIFWHRYEDYYMLCCKPIGEFDKGFDKWYPINDKFENIANILIEIMNNKVLPLLDNLNTAKKIIENISFMKENKIYNDQVILFCALKENNKDIAMSYLDQIVDVFNKDDRQVDWVINDRNMFNNFYNLLKNDKFNEINNILDNYAQNFIKYNKYIIK